MYNKGAIISACSGCLYEDLPSTDSQCVKCARNLGKYNYQDRYVSIYDVDSYMGIKEDKMDWVRFKITGINRERRPDGYTRVNAKEVDSEKNFIIVIENDRFNKENVRAKLVEEFEAYINYKNKMGNILMAGDII